MNNFIGSGFLSDLNICDRLISLYEINKHKEENGSLGGSSGKKIVDEKLKKNKEIYFTYDEPQINEYCKQLQHICDLYIKEYEFCNVAPWQTRESIKIQKYNPGDGYFQWHSERVGSNPQISNRHLVFMTYLNDVNDGGVTEFYYQKVKIKPQKGLTLIWPSEWTHTHRGITSPTETKYIITGWFHYIM